MKRFFLKMTVLAGMLLGLPLLGVMVAGEPAERFLEFPPRTIYVRHAPFSEFAFAAYSAAILIAVSPFLRRAFRAPRGGRSRARHRFPWWGWTGLAAGAASWVFAWSRFEWFASFQPHTFTPLWLSYLVVVNGLSMRRKGDSLLTGRTGFFLSLFPASAAFWWFFEYLNRFIQNWHYPEADFGPGAYFLRASIPFSTVLPAVLSTQEWVNGFGPIQRGFRNFAPIRLPRPRLAAGCALLIAGAGLAGVGVRPDQLFSMVWVAPLLIIVSLQTLWGDRHVFSGIAAGDWRPVVSAAVAALICGIFWEMWNFYSLARWVYNIPYVHRFKIFEMPILGYAGYLPFGVVCAAAGEMIAPLFDRKHSIPPGNRV